MTNRMQMIKEIVDSIGNNIAATAPVTTTIKILKIYMNLLEFWLFLRWFRWCCLQFDRFVFGHFLCLFLIFLSRNNIIFFITFSFTFSFWTAPQSVICFLLVEQNNLQVLVIAHLNKFQTSLKAYYARFTLQWFLGEKSAISRREIGEKSARFTLQWFLGDFSARNRRFLAEILPRK